VRTDRIQIDSPVGTQHQAIDTFTSVELRAQRVIGSGRSKKANNGVIDAELPRT
jgi:hypothetical protein